MNSFMKPRKDLKRTRMILILQSFLSFIDKFILEVPTSFCILTNPNLMGNVCNDDKEEHKIKTNEHIIQKECLKYSIVPLKITLCAACSKNTFILSLMKKLLNMWYALYFVQTSFQTKCVQFRRNLRSIQSIYIDENTYLQYPSPPC